MHQDGDSQFNYFFPEFLFPDSYQRFYFSISQHNSAPVFSAAFPLLHELRSNLIGKAVEKRRLPRLKEFAVKAVIRDGKHIRISNSPFLLEMDDKLIVAGSMASEIGEMDDSKDRRRRWIMLGLMFLMIAGATLGQFIKSPGKNQLDMFFFAAIAFPIAYAAATQLGVDPKPLFITICIAASSTFSTPIGYQTNLIVQSIGNYRFSDFWKIGLPLNIMMLIICLLVIPLFWPF